MSEATSNITNKSLDQESLEMHASGRPGKIEITPTKPLTTQRDLALAYSPGVGAPCLAIAENPNAAYDYTAKGNLVAVISNGTAVLGLGNLGAQASKPVMEGKAVLFKRFADIDGLDLEVDTENVDEFVSAVRYLGPSFGGINLEDIKAPECFIIESKLKELMDIPIFHDDQHGTAIVAVAGMLNALEITGRDIKKCKIVVNGAGAAAIACIELIKAMGLPHENAILCDSKGVIYKGREERMNQWKSAHAVETKARTLEEAMAGADVFFGLSVKGAVTQSMVRNMAAKPIIFAMANPDPEITPEDVLSVREDAIIATGRSDYPNQVNNVLGFPYIFRGALDVRAKSINEEMKIAAAKAIADLAKLPVPEEVDEAYPGIKLRYGPNYIIPVPFDPRLITTIPPAVAKAAVDSGVSLRPRKDWINYRRELYARRNPSASTLQMIFQKLTNSKKRIVFAEAEEERMLRAAISFKNSGYGTPILIGRRDDIEATADKAGITGHRDLEIHDIFGNSNCQRYADLLYKRLQRKGVLYRDCERIINTERNIYAASMVAIGDADGMVTGLTRNFTTSLNDVHNMLDAAENKRLFGLSLAIEKNKTYFISDTSVHELPTAEELADIAIMTADYAKQFGHDPRVAFLSFSNFGNPDSSKTQTIREAVNILDNKKVDFEYEGEMSADVALDPNLMKMYPFCRLSRPANVLIMPGLHSANISQHLLAKLAGGTVIGPLLMGLEKPVQIVQMGSTINDIVNAAAFAAHDALSNDFFTKYLK